MPPKEPKEEHINEFMRVLKEELKKDKEPLDPRVAKMEERLLARGRRMPPSILIARLEHLNRRRRLESEEETWLSLARTVYEYWEKENYPDTESPPIS
jgi:hypothetical protein